MVSRAAIQAAKGRHRLSAVIGSYLPIKGKGRNIFALCPFHADKSPSLHISDAKGLYYCQACGAAGDAVTFLREYAHLTWDEALVRLGLDPIKQWEDRQRRRPTDPAVRALWARGIPSRRLSDSLRWSPDGQGLMGLVTLADGEPVAVIERLRITGELHNGAVKIGRARGTIGLAASPIDAYRMHLTYAIPVWAIHNEGRFNVVSLPASCRNVTLFAWHMLAAFDAAEDLEARGKTVSFIHLGGSYGGIGSLSETRNPSFPRAVADSVDRTSATTPLGD